MKLNTAARRIACGAAAVLLAAMTGCAQSGAASVPETTPALPLTEVPETSVPETAAPETEPPVEEPTDTRSLSEKLKAGDAVRILVIGDSVSAPGSKWIDNLANALTKTYGSAVSVENLSLGGNGSYAGCVCAIRADGSVPRDLIIFSHGHNDGVDSDGFWYEEMVRVCRQKFPYASMISVLESSRRGFNVTIDNIRAIAEHYGIWEADTVTPFTDGTYGDYEELVGPDGVHPNPAGQYVYYLVLKAVITDHVDAMAPAPGEIPEPLLPGHEKYADAMWIGAEQFTYDRDTESFVYVFPEDVTGDLGVDFTFLPITDNRTVISAGGSELMTYAFDWSMYPVQRHIMQVGAFSARAGDELRVTLTNAEASEGFGGVIIFRP